MVFCNLFCTFVPVKPNFVTNENLAKTFMQKQRLNLEYPLSVRKPDLLWQLLSTDHGLERWLADHVIEENGVMRLTWGDIYGEHHTLNANILERQKNSHIRLQWVDEDDPDAFWEMRIGQSELTEELCLCVVDYAPAEDIDDLHELWDGNLDRLHQSSGF
jgi:uncharacterized protein YndB with AHSA1/START domain